MKNKLMAALAVFVAVAVSLSAGIATRAADDPAKQAETSAPVKTEVATFGSGCFWCTEADFDKVPGVLTTISGYMGGHVENPTYKQVITGTTGHAEVLQVTYDPARVTYQQLLDYYWRHVDFLDGEGQFCDRGNQYRPVIFAHTPEQKELALKGKEALGQQFKQPIAVEITEASKFTEAEEYHQNYYKRHPMQYLFYRYGCGRDRRIEQIWANQPKS